MACLTSTSAHNESDVQEELLQSRYAKWKQGFEDRTMPELRKKHLFSTSYEILWDEAWAEYDELESVRIREGFVKQTWQNVVDEDRRLEEVMRKYKSKSRSFTVYDLSQVPLGMKLENYLGRSVQSEHARGNVAMAIALERWRIFREVMANQPEFRHSLSWTQKASWTILSH